MPLHSRLFRLTIARFFVAAHIIAAAALILSTSARAADRGWSIRSWQRVDGLPNDTVTAIAQAADGYLWIATWDAVVRFDGAHFETCDFSTLPGLKGMTVWRLFPARDGGMWIGMDRGPVALIKPNVPPRVYIEKLPSDYVDSMVEDSDGALWVGYRHGAICRIANNKVTSIGPEVNLPAATNTAIVLDAQNQLWIARDRRLGQIRAGQFTTLAELPSDKIYLAKSSAGGLWACAGLQVYKCADDGTLKSYGKLSVTSSGSDEAIPFEDRTATLWVGTSESGLFRYNGSEFENVATPQPRMFCLADDREGNLWLGTSTGLDRVQPLAVQLEGPETGLPFGTVNSICEDGAGRIWAASGDGKLLAREADHWNPAKIELPEVPQCVAADLSDGIWIGARTRGRLFQWREGQLRPQNIGRADSTCTVRALLATKTGDLWIGSTSPDRLQCLRDGRTINIPLPAAVGFLDSIADDGAGGIWAGSEKGGLVHIDSRNHLTDESTHAPGRSIRCLYPLPDRSLLIGYRSAGLARFSSGQLHFVTMANGLTEDTVSQIVADDEGWLWIGGDHGISRVRLQELNDLMEDKISKVQSFHYGADQGLPRLHARWSSSPGCTRTSDGRLWMPMETALAVIDPKRVREQPNPPPVQIQRVLVDDELVKSSTIFADAKFDDSAASTLKLPPGYSRLEIDFTALAFSAPESTRFRFRLDGFEKNWNEVTEPRRAVYPQLAAGEYYFRVIAGNADGIWNEQGTGFAVHIAPFVWDTWWFRAIVAALALALILVLARYVTLRRLRRRLRELEQRSALDRERARIARDLHDDLGHGLTQIVLLSDLTSQDQPHSPERNGQLGQIAVTAKQGIKSLDEAVWAINPRNDTLPDLIDYLGNFAMQSLRAAGIRCQLDLPDHPPLLHVASEVRHSLFLSVKEAVTNVLRHAQATSVALAIALHESDLIITIADNGCGFVPGASRAEQDGLANMRDRMASIGGLFKVESAPGAGTKIQLNLALFGGSNGQSRRAATEHHVAH